MLASRYGGSMRRSPSDRLPQLFLRHFPHKYVVVDRHSTFEGAEDYQKLLEFGADLPLAFGSPLSNASYTFDLWQSKALN
jgi:hypothetical protein